MNNGFTKSAADLEPMPVAGAEDLPENEKGPDPELVTLAEEWKRQVEARGDEFVAHNFNARGQILAKIRVKAEGRQNGTEQAKGTLVLVLKNKKGEERILGGGKVVIGEETIGNVFTGDSPKEQFDQFGVEEWKKEVEARGDKFEPIDKNLPYRVIEGKILAKIRKKNGKLYAILKGLNKAEIEFPDEDVVASEMTVNVVANGALSEKQFMDFINDMRGPLKQIADAKKNS